MSSSEQILDIRYNNDENTPHNFQDIVNFPKKDQCDNFEVFLDGTESVQEVSSPETSENTEEALEDEALKDFGKFSEPIFEGKGFHRASNFYESECGEPIKNQFLRLDFTPIKGVDDNEFILNKCLSFWAFVERQEEIKGLRASPEELIKLEDDELKTLSTLSYIKEPTAMECLKDQDMLGKAFVAENKMQYCAGGDGDYASWALPKPDTRNHAEKVRRRRSNSRKSTDLGSAKKQSTEDVKTLCKQLEEWDLTHPKSMEPPGHPPKDYLCFKKMDS